MKKKISQYDKIELMSKTSFSMSDLDNYDVVTTDEDISRLVGELNSLPAVSLINSVIFWEKKLRIKNAKGTAEDRAANILFILNNRMGVSVEDVERIAKNMCGQ